MNEQLGIWCILLLLPISLLNEDKPPPNGKDVVFTVTNRPETPLMFSTAEIDELPHVEIKAEILSIVVYGRFSRRRLGGCRFRR